MSPTTQRSDDPALVARTLIQVMALSALLHLTFMSARVALILTAISMDTPVWLLGLLQATYPLAGAIFSVPFGRLIDRYGASVSMRWGALGVAGCAVVPAFFTTLPVFFVMAFVIGAVGNVFYLAALQVVAQWSPVEKRVQWLSWNSVIYSVSSFAAPLSAGLAIDHFGHRWALGLAALPAAIAGLAMLHPAIRLPGPAPAGEARGHGGIFHLLRNPRIRAVIMLGATLMVLWDLHSFVVPVYGSQLGLSATTIGTVLSALSISMLVSRLAVPVLARRFAPWTLVTGALALTALGYALYPFATTVTAMFALTALIGIGAGVNQPLSNAMLIEYSPEGRSGESFGLRNMISHVLQLSIPALMGTLIATAGIKLVFWLLAGTGTVGVVFGRRTRRMFRRTRRMRTEKPASGGA